ncbi:hypothetical protein ABEY03_16435 [Bacillus inaquosorum]|uniref:hypothetical protein n=1 Tax=Bacillus inaquosorum TaxID=483913 RepID=UPI003D1F8BAD
MDIPKPIIDNASPAVGKIRFKDTSKVRVTNPITEIIIAIMVKRYEMLSFFNLCILLRECISWAAENRTIITEIKNDDTLTTNTTEGLK